MTTSSTTTAATTTTILPLPTSESTLNEYASTIDEQILLLLNQRMECSLQVGRIKAKNEAAKRGNSVLQTHTSTSDVSENTSRATSSDDYIENSHDGSTSGNNTNKISTPAEREKA
jgi:chorismate mutase